MVLKVFFRCAWFYHENKLRGFCLSMMHLILIKNCPKFRNVQESFLWDGLESCKQLLVKKTDSNNRNTGETHPEEWCKTKYLIYLYIGFPVFMSSVAVSNARIYLSKPTHLYLSILCLCPDSEHVTMDNSLHIFPYLFF